MSFSKFSVSLFFVISDKQDNKVKCLRFRTYAWDDRAIAQNWSHPHHPLNRRECTLAFWLPVIWFWPTKWTASEHLRGNGLVWSMVSTRERNSFYCFGHLAFGYYTIYDSFIIYLGQKHQIQVIIWHKTYDDGKSHFYLLLFSKQQSIQT